MLRIIGGSARGRKIETPAGRDTRPTLDRVRENLFNMLQGRVMGARVLDPFTGSGALSLEALSRGAVFAEMADRDRGAARVAQANLEKLGFADRGRVTCAAWEKTLESLRAGGERFDLILLDPPYAMTDLREVTGGLIPLMAEGALMVLERQADAAPRVAEELSLWKDRTWGYCGVSIYERLCDSGIL